MLTINNLHVGVDNKEVLNGVNLTIKSGEIHAIMGPNGSGKSTLANAIIGHPKYQITKGKILWKNKNLLTLRPEQRAKNGIFLGFQNPPEIPGVTVSCFLKNAINALRKEKREKSLNPLKFRESLAQKLSSLSLDASFSERYLNNGFSGGEKKKMEILQMAMLEPHLAILDEPDSGLDIDSLKIVAKNINKSLSPGRAILIITHYQRILKYVKPDFIHIMLHGRIIESGKGRLSLRLEKEGYGWLKEKILMTKSQ